MLQGHLPQVSEEGFREGFVRVGGCRSLRAQGSGSSTQARSAAREVFQDAQRGLLWRRTDVGRPLRKIHTLETLPEDGNR